MKVVLGVAALVLSVSVGVVYAQKTVYFFDGALRHAAVKIRICLICGWQG